MQRIPQISHAFYPSNLRPVSNGLRFYLPYASTISSPRLLSQSPFVRYPRKDSQDKDSINTEATEYSKSGTDDASAGHEDTAFDPDVTEPGHQKDKVGEKTGVSISIDSPFSTLIA